MSERDAVRFIERVSGDLELQSRLRDIDPRDDLDQVVEIAVDVGFEFDVAQLRAAFLTDWKMRRRFYTAIADPRSRSSKS